MARVHSSMPKSASAPAFLVISTQQQFATCTGTREQLITAGLVHPDNFPKGRARKYYAVGYTVSRVKGGNFKWESCHEQRGGANSSLIKYFQINDHQNGMFDWKLVLTDRISKDIADEQMRTELWDYGRDVFRIVRRARERYIKKSLALVKSAPAYLGVTRSISTEVQHG